MSVRSFTVAACSLAFGLFLHAASSWAGPLLVGGACRYDAFPGKATIVAITPAPAAEARAEGQHVAFRFKPAAPVANEPLYHPKAIHELTLTGGSLPDQAFVRKYSLKKGKTLSCTMHIIRQGTCTPVIFAFPNIDLTDHGQPTTP